MPESAIALYSAAIAPLLPLNRRRIWYSPPMAATIISRQGEENRGFRTKRWIKMNKDLWLQFRCRRSA
jgi:hypothetical protein